MPAKAVQMRRKFLAARHDLAQRVNESSKSSGRTVFSIVNEALSAFLEAEESGRSLSSVMDEQKMIHSAKNSGMILVPETCWERLLESSHDCQAVYEGWRASGAVFGRYLRVSGLSEDPRKVEAALRTVAGGIPDITIQRDRLLFISPRLGERQTEAVAAFLEGVLAGLDLGVTGKEVSKGIVVIGLKR